ERGRRGIARHLAELRNVAEVQRCSQRVEIVPLENVLHVPTQLDFVALLDLEVLLRRDLRPAQRQPGDDVASGVAHLEIAFGAVEPGRDRGWAAAWKSEV